MDSNEVKHPPASGDDDGARRVPRRFLPLASVVGAFGVVAAGVLRAGEVPAASAPGAGSPGDAPRQPAAALPSPPLPQQYARVAVLAAPGTAGEFRRSLLGISVGPRDGVYVLGDGEVRVFEAGGKVVRRWTSPEKASCLGVAADGRVAVGSPGRVDLFSEAGAHIGGFAAGTPDKPAEVSAVRFAGGAVLVADARARIIRRYDGRGVEQGVIGAGNKTGGFMLPNKSLDFDVDRDGVIHAADSGRHQVSSWTLDGAPVGRFGRFGMARPDDFVGCCNPVNVAVGPAGVLVTAEKVAARVKIFGKDRSLLAVIGPEHFDPMCRHIHVAVDSTGRIVAADPERRTITLFERS
jgi:hypothetical protein